MNLSKKNRSYIVLGGRQTKAIAKNNASATKEALIGSQRSIIKEVLQKNKIRDT